MKKSLMVCFLWMLSAAQAQSTTVTESTDFPGVSGFGSATTSAALTDLSGNAVSGSLSGSHVLVDSLFVTISDVVGPPGIDSSSQLTDASTTYLLEPFATNNATSATLISSLGPDIYSLSMFGQNPRTSGVYMTGGLVELNVSSVPVPAALWLFGSGFMGLIGFSKYKKTRIDS